MDESPFTRGRVVERGVHWVRPELVAEVVFSEWTTDGELRHPRFEAFGPTSHPGTCSASVRTGDVTSDSVRA
jgi:ATP-dependent DNA ligase